MSATYRVFPSAFIAKPFGTFNLAVARGPSVYPPPAAPTNVTGVPLLVNRLILCMFESAT